MQYVHQLKKWGVRKYNVESFDSPGTATGFGTDRGSNSNLAENRSSWRIQQDATKIERKLQKIPDPPWKESFAARQISMLLDNRYAFRMFTSDYQEYLMLKVRCLSGCGYYKEAFPIYKVVWLNISRRSDSFVDHYLILDELVHSATTHSDFEAVQSMDPCVYRGRY